MASPDFAPPTADDLTRAIAAGVKAPVDETLWERRMKALTLRNAGGTFAQIAAQLGISPTVCRADVRQALREILSETTEDFIARQRSVLLDLQRGAYPLALKGDKDSIMAIVRCLEQEAKLLGLYAPARVVAGISNVDFAEQAADLISSLGLVPPKELTQHVRREYANDAERAVAAAGMAAADQILDASEVVDGVIERIAGLGIDIPAYDLPVDPADGQLESAITDEAVSAAAAAAIDPETYGGDRQADPEHGGWSNL
jgi:hypothetical protein